MRPVANTTLAVAQFGLTKRASFSSILPGVALPALGVYLGRMWGDTGRLIGGISGGVAGSLVREHAEKQQRMSPQSASPYALDASNLDIPPWALAGAQFAAPAMKSAEFGVADTIGGDILGSAWPVVNGIRENRDGKQIAKSVAGQTAGVIGGGLAGDGVGHLINHLAGRTPETGIKVPGVKIPLSVLLGGLGATIGSYHGSNWANK